MISFSQKDITMDQNFPFSYVIFFGHQKQFNFRVCVFIHIMDEKKKMFFFVIMEKMAFEKKK